MLEKFRQEIRQRASLAISGAFALIIALSWNETIKTIVNSFVIRLNVPDTSYWYYIVISLVVTIISVIGIVFSSRYGSKKNKKMIISCQTSF